jgi:hypothetical protein
VSFEGAIGESMMVPSMAKNSGEKKKEENLDSPLQIHMDSQSRTGT